MADNFDVLFSSKLDAQTFKEKKVHIKSSKQGRVIELLSKTPKGLSALFKKIFGTEQRHLAAACTSSPGLTQAIKSEGSLERLQNLKANLVQVEDWVSRYNKRLGPLSVLFKVKCL